MAVRCSACGQWIKTTGGTYSYPGSSKTKEELLDMPKHVKVKTRLDHDNECYEMSLPSISSI
ncbi:hypothetical protein N7493_003277 [Penicillium malachiteum]|uniref:Uncharacterized protein n=1 Tax=Penicillium malachiteum TaxID=1324776 RepID=A0AAD6HTG1_9EURO|nr:hypothetical protein N7493_003277 [Penicillium malachiteum]